MDYGLEGKVVVITGAASGLGLAMAKSYAAIGAKPVITDISQEALDRACEEIGPNVVAYLHDVTDLESIPALIAKIESEVGPIECLINNAGKHQKKFSDEVTDAEFQSVIEVNLFGVFAMTREVFKYMKERGRGSIQMISSMTAIIGQPRVVAYSVTKTGLLGATRTLASDFSPFGVRVNAIQPGFIDTPMFRKAVDGDQDRQNRILTRTPLQKYGHPQDIANASLFLASNKAEFINGIALPVDGGFSIGF
ncbi:SDR family NAD(P)-dependent oxidoreductase [Pseudovibrio flavus]|uniref:SDR family NAD(P)-dependent oxidoreductase n=1 Tax=Pseudovibrio flavus TaxID=2529854 RepID=UPI00211BB6E3|nr:glucose 1-dehydrogenase [Pseudovibrio flavus]